MANIINNSLMAFGSKSDLEILKDLLENKEKTIKILSQDIFGIYKPKDTRYLDDSNFGLFPGGFSDDVTVWDIGFWKDEILNYDFRENDSQGFIDLIYNWSENIASNEECLLFSFQSKYSEPDTGFAALSKLINKLSFYWFCYGEYDDASHKEFHYEDGNQTFEDSE